MLSGINLTHAHDYNRLLVLQTVRLKAPATRAEIARLTGLTAPAVSSIVTDLIRAGFVSELGRRSPSRGQPPIELAINPSGAYTLGLHLDYNVLKGVLVNLEGSVLTELSLDHEAPSPDEALSMLIGAHRRLTEAAGVPQGKILGIGLVTVGPQSVHSGRVIRPPHFAGWDVVPLKAPLAKATALPVFLDNNATAAAIGEFWYGAGRARRDFLYVYMGLGVGGGLFLGGRVHRGVSLNAGEFGHLAVEADGLPCACGSHGCLETRTSLLALSQSLGAAYCSPAHLARQFSLGNPELLDWLESASRVMARAVVSVDNLLDLEAAIFGGRIPEEVLEHFVARVAHHCHGVYMRGRLHRIALEVGRTGEGSAALGAAILPIYDVFSPELAPAGGDPGRKLRQARLAGEVMPKD